MASSKPFQQRGKQPSNNSPFGDLAKYTVQIIESSTCENETCVVIPSTIGRFLCTIDALRHEGMFHDVFTIGRFFKLPSWPRLVILVGPMEITREHVTRVKAHVQSGNALLVLGPIPSLEDVLGIMYHVPVFPFSVGGKRDDSIGEGYMHWCDGAFGKKLNDDWFPLHALGCTAVLADGAEKFARFETKHASSEDWAAITARMNGTGVAMQIAVDLPGTIRRVQEGRYIDTDGIPPPDGMSPVDDGILKCEDGLVLDWTRDRRLISPGYHVPAFMIPVADAWRKVLVACIEHLAEKCKIPVRRIWYWPGGKEFVALISHDSDGNDESLAEHLLAEVGKAGIKTTWCMAAPGYSRKTCDKIAAAGHELAFHFDAISYPDGKQKDPEQMNCLFSKAILEKQLDEVQKRSGREAFYSNKNHYTRWAGRIQFFEWCEQLGIRVDQSKGPSKCGTFGFPFGSCHPWQPMNDAGAMIGCLEISFQSQDFGMQGPADTIDEMLDAVKKANGVAHVIFHPAHSQKPDVNKAMHEFITKATNSGAIFMTSKAIGEWTFNRKWLVATGKSTLDGAVIHEYDATNGSWREISRS